MNEQEWKNFRADLSEALSTADDKYIEKLEKQAEIFLQEQLKSALAITQRAITIAALFGALIASIVGVTATLVTKNIDIGPHFFTAILLVIPLFASLYMTVQAARPATFDYAGSNPRYWLGDLKDTKKPFKLAQAQQVAWYSQGITENAANLKSSADGVQNSLWVAGVGLLIASMYEFILSLSYMAQFGLPRL